MTEHCECRQHSQIVPARAGFRVQRSGGHLGFELGPVGGEATWGKAEAEWVRRARTIAASGAPPRVRAVQYNCRALPVLL